MNRLNAIRTRRDYSNDFLGGALQRLEDRIVVWLDQQGLYTGSSRTKREAEFMQVIDRVVAGDEAAQEIESMLRAWRAIDDVRHAITLGDAERAAARMHFAMKHVLYFNFDGYMPDIKAGRKFNVKGRQGGRPADVANQEIKKVLDAVHKQHPRWNITALRDEAADALGITRCTLERRCKYNPKTI